MLMKVLITGAFGFLGSYIFEEFQNLNYLIDTLGRRNSATIVIDFNKGEFSLSDYYDIVVHVAGKAHSIPKNKIEEEEFYNVNVLGTNNLLRALIKKPKYFIFISSVSVYGLKEGELIKENTKLAAKDPYGQSKIHCEELITNWSKTNNVTTTILRLPLLVGFNPPGNLKSIIDAVKAGYYFNISKGDAKKSMVLAQNVASFIPVIMSKGGVYNLTDGDHPTFRILTNKIANHYNLRLPFSFPKFFIYLLAICCDVFERIFNRELPFNLLKYSKMTTSLTFCDEFARTNGWKSDVVIDNEKLWLN